ncbi:MAG: phosphoadenylyl-sulfate reductase [Candidatus Sumerlaeia bacterium]
MTAQLPLDPALLAEIESKPAHEIVAWALERWGRRVALASSFGAEDVVLIHMMAGVSADARVFTLDTGRLPNETYDVMDAIRTRYGIRIESYFPDRERVEAMVRDFGFNLMYHSIENRKLCCRIRKVEPLQRALAGLDAWITGLRRGQSVTRADVAKVEWDDAHRLVKINPLADWSEQQVWEFIRINNVPYNRLHDIGYASIGCAPCTRPIKKTEDVRAGRWWWEEPEKKECGLHLKPR